MQKIYLKELAGIGLFCLSGFCKAGSYTFDTALLGQGVNKTDIAIFEQGGQIPGTYKVEVFINGEFMDSRDIVFELKKDEHEEFFLEPCLSRELLTSYGVKVEEYEGLFNKIASLNACADLSAIPKANAKFQYNAQQLLLSIPQVALHPKVTGIAPQALWNDGIFAGLMNYRINTNRTEYRGSSSNSNNAQFIQLEPGVNIGAWRIRNSTNWQRSGQEQGKWQTVYTYAERGLYALKSRLMLGEGSTPSDVFDSVSFRGIMLGSDVAMVPFNQREYAPIIRGIAQTQARVEVRQNGYTLYSTTVAAGPFALTDLTPGSSAGDLEVTVREANGNTQVFTVPYQTPAIALREGYLKYSTAVGHYRAANTSAINYPLGQATVMYGLPLNLTAYGGVQAAENYHSGSLGLGLSLGSWGSLSLDTIRTRGKMNGGLEEKGGSSRFRYSKAVKATNTNVTLASSQYASSGYRTLSEVMNTYSESKGYVYNDNRFRRKSRTSLTVSQSLGKAGYFSLSAVRGNYWNRPGYDDSLGASYGVGLGRVSLSFNWSKNMHAGRSGNQRNDQITSLQVSVPVGRGSENAAYANYQLTSSSQAGDTHEAGLSGQALDRQLFWNVNQRYRAGEQSSDSSSSALQLMWNGSYGQYRGNYSYSPELRQMGTEIAGGVVLHRNGITLGQPLGETVALIEAEGASGVKVGGSPGVKTDFRGYTTHASLSPYQENRVSLDPSLLADDAEITQTDVKVIPTQGAVVWAKFTTRIGGRALMTLTQPDGTMVPFGALAKPDSKGAASGVVGSRGQVYLTGLADKGTVMAEWGQGQKCRLDYRLPQNKGPAGMYTLTGICQ